MTDEEICDFMGWPKDAIAIEAVDDESLVTRVAMLVRHLEAVGSAQEVEVPHG